MNRNTFIFLILHTFCAAQGQNPTISNEIDSITAKWNYIVYPEAQELKVIEYYPAYSRCGRLYINAMAICTNTRGETIRVIETCPGPKNIKSGELVYFYPSSVIPRDTDPHLVYFDEKLILILKNYQEITTTTFGQLIKQ